MTHPYLHYEAAFQDYLRCRGIAYIAVDETKKAVFAGAKIKSFDFLIYPSVGPNLIVDVKGRQFPYQGSSSRRYWENWITQEDLDGLAQWQHVFGDGFVAHVVFAYWLTNPDLAAPISPHHAFRGQHYAFLAVPLGDYRAHARRRSAKWGTVAVSAGQFRQMARPVVELW
jgi:hypothetical protein